MLTWLGLLLSLGSCRPNQGDSLTPLTTDQLARLEEWQVSGPSSQTGMAMLTDTLNWLRVEQAYYYIEHAITSNYRYDAQKRLSQQTVSGYRNDSDYGRNQSIRTHEYRYNPTELTILTTGNWVNKSYGQTTFSMQQHLTLNQGGLVDSQPWLGDMYSGGDNGYSGISRLFSTCLNSYARDSLRRYDDQGYLLGAFNSFTTSWSEPWRFNQSIEAGNVVSRQLQTVAPVYATGKVESIRWVEQYDRSQPTIPNPHQFLGSTSRNLVGKTLRYNPNETSPTVLVYRYEYDTKGRVARYFISRDWQGISTLQTVGKLTYLTE